MNKKKGDVEIDQLIIIIIAIILLIVLIIIAFTSRDKLVSLGEKFYNIIRFFGAK